ncbi:hypothetical protein GS504_03240 [Rhodococcus hoagii]|nr:hypothetical protein [Prescottella equi]
MAGKDWFPTLDPSSFDPEPQDGSETGDEGDQDAEDTDSADAEPEGPAVTPSRPDESDPDPSTDLDESAAQTSSDPVDDAVDPVEPVGSVVRALTVTPRPSTAGQPDWASDWVDAPADEPDQEVFPAQGADRIGIAEPEPGTADAERRNRRTRLAVGGAVATLAVVGVGVAAAALTSGSGGDAEAQSVVVPGTTTSATTTAATSTQAPPPWCPSTVDGDVIRGDGPGGTGSGPEAIFGFQHAFFVLHDAAKVREFVTPEMAADQLKDLQTGIDQSVQPGTAHCLTVRPAPAPGSFDIELTVKGPDGETSRYRPQTVTTQVRDGRTLISAIVQHQN